VPGGGPSGVPRRVALRGQLGASGSALARRTCPGHSRDLTAPGSCYGVPSVFAAHSETLSLLASSDQNAESGRRFAKDASWRWRSGTVALRASRQSACGVPVRRDGGTGEVQSSYDRLVRSPDGHARSPGQSWTGSEPCAARRSQNGQAWRSLWTRLVGDTEVFVEYPRFAMRCTMRHRVCPKIGPKRRVL
jgi:hypothetical protein